MLLPPPQSVASTFNPGRLGNQLSTFASLYSVWREFGIYNFVTPGQLDILNNVFDLPESDKHSNDWPYFVWNIGNVSLQKYFLFLNKLHICKNN